MSGNPKTSQNKVSLTEEWAEKNNFYNNLVEIQK